MSSPNMNLAAKYRPRRFGEVVGQATVIEGLRLAVASTEIRQSYLFCGPTGSGKTTTARILAAAINCTDPHQGEPCGRCDRCEILQPGEVPWMSYYEEISCAQASNREALQEALRHRDLGTIANRRVYLLDEAHALDYNAQSWLLGPLEDRDSKPLFILCTTEPEKLQSAVRDRCIDVAFGAVADQDLAGLLLSVAAKEGIQLGVPDAVGLAQQAGGSPRNALSLLDGSAHGLTTEHRSTAERIVAAMAAHNVGTMLVEVREAVASGEFRAAAVRGLAVEYWLDLLAHKRGAADSYRTSPRLRQHFEVARAIPEEVIASRLKVLADLDLAGQAGLRAELALEAALVQCISATDLDRHLAVMRRLDRLQSVVSRLVENPEGGAA